MGRKKTTVVIGDFEFKFKYRKKVDLGEMTIYIDLKIGKEYLLPGTIIRKSVHNPLACMKRQYTHLEHNSKTNEIELVCVGEWDCEYIAHIFLDRNGVVRGRRKTKY